jgi:hypothetical protein
MIHDVSDHWRFTDPESYQAQPVSERGIAEFARRVAAEKGDVDGLRELFGGVGIDVLGHQLLPGSLFIVHHNGNHRLAAFSALEVPCVLATVTWVNGTYRSVATTDEQTRYRRMLSAARITQELDDPFYLDAITDWPILIRGPLDAVESLSAYEEILGRQVTEPIGRLTRDHFNDPARLDKLAARVDRKLTRLFPSP